MNSHFKLAEEFKVYTRLLHIAILLVFVQITRTLSIDHRMLGSNLTDGNRVSREQSKIGDTILYSLPKMYNVNALLVTVYKTFGWSVLRQAAFLDVYASTEGILGYVQRIGAASDSVPPQSTEVYGVGAYLLAG